MENAVNRVVKCVSPLRQQRPAFRWCRRAGYAGRALAAALGVSHQAVPAAATRGERLAARWDRVWDRLR